MHNGAEGADLSDMAVATSTHTERPRRVDEEILLWSAVATVGLNAIAALVFAFAALAQWLGSESCYGFCGESHIGNPVILGVVFSAGPAFYLSIVSLIMAAMIVVRRPSFVRTPRGFGLVTAGAAAFAVEWGIWTIAGDAGWDFPASTARFLIVLSVSMPIPLALPVMGIIYSVVTLRRYGPNSTVLALGTVALADLAFGVYWWSFTDRSF